MIAAKTAAIIHDISMPYSHFFKVEDCRDDRVLCAFSFCLPCKIIEHTGKIPCVSVTWTHFCKKVLSLDVLLWWDVFHVMSKTFLVTSIGDSCYGVFIESNSFKCSDKRSTIGRPFALAPSNVHCITWSSQVDASLNDRGSFFVHDCTSSSDHTVNYFLYASPCPFFCVCGTIPAFCELSCRFSVNFALLY